MEQKKIKILFDCRTIQTGHFSSGVPKDWIAILNLLKHNSSIDMYVLINSTFHSPWYDFFLKKIKNKHVRLLFVILYHFLNSYKLFLKKYKVPSPITNLRKPPHIDPAISSVVHGDVSKIYTLNHSYCLTADYFYSMLQRKKKHYAYFGINAEQFDYVWFTWILQVLPIASNTTKIIRHYDNIPIKVISNEPGRFYYKLKDASETKSRFICISKPTEEEMKNFVVNIVPLQTSIIDTTNDYLAKHYGTIPIIFTPHNSHSNKTDVVETINRRRFNSTYIASVDTKYILFVGSSERRKNYINILIAWNALQKEKNDDIKLLFVTTITNNQNAYNFIKPFMDANEIICLPYVDKEELIHLYSHAECFVFPSFLEGFGMPPMEAMQCGCPCIISDIPELNWVYGDAALKANPYSIEDLKNKLDLLLYSEKKEEIRSEYIRKGYERINLYTEENVAPQWDAFIRSL